MAKKIRVYELARELGLSNKECLDLCESLGIGVKSHSSSMEDAHADRARRKAVREGLVRETPPEEDEAAPAADDQSKKVVSTKKPPPKKAAAAAPPEPESPVAAPAPAEAAPPPQAAPAVAEVAPAPAAPPPAPAAPAPAAPPPAAAPAAPAAPPTKSTGRRITSSGSSGPIRPAPAEAPAPAAAAAAPAAPARPAPKPRPPAGPAPATPSSPGAVPLGPSGKPIPPPPAPRSLSGKPIPPPPGRGGRGAAPARPSGPPRRGPGGSPGGGGGPSGPRPGGGGRPGGPPGRGRGPQRPPRRRKSRRRRRNLEELRPVDVPTYTPAGAAVPTGVVIIERHSTPQELGAKLSRTAADVVRFLLTNGEMVSATQSLNDELIELFAEDLGVKIRLVDLGEEQEEEMRELLEVPDYEDDDEELEEASRESRPPVVTIMGHVDHGKTKLLDQIRNANVVDGEAGGITQHIGAYQTDHNGSIMTFIDTPGHEAFTAIRARGAEATDIVILVVAADDGVMPQTVEAINHAKASGKPIIVAINKIDRENANPDRVMNQLSEHDLVPEAWGGDTIVMQISALVGTGVEELLDQILVVAEIEELSAVMDTRAMGVVLESNLSVGRGPVSTLLVQHGVLKVGEPCVAGAAWGRVRALINDRGEQIKEAGPSMPVEVLGLSGVASAGDEFIVAQNEKVAGKVADSRGHWRRVQELSSRDSDSAPASGRLEDLFAEIEAGKAAVLNLIVKADAHGSLEALRDSLKRLNRDDVRLSIVHSGVGGLTENDITLGAASESIIIAFNVRPDRKARETAAAEGVEIRNYEIIYKVLEDIEAAMLGMLTPEVEEVVTGEAEVREIFRIKGVGLIAGCMVQSGTIKRNDKVRFLREGAIIWKGTLTSLKRFTEDATEVRAGFECGVGLSDFQDLIQGDIIETFEEREIPIT